MKKVFFGLIATVMLSVSGFASNVVNGTITKQEITSYTIDGKSYSPAEFSALSPELLNVVIPCTIIVSVTITINGITRTTSHTETFEASWWGCFFTKVGAFLASALGSNIKL